MSSPNNEHHHDVRGTRTDDSAELTPNPQQPLLIQRFYSEDEVQLEWEGKYDQEKFHQGFLDDECDHDFAFRYITQWSLKVPSKYLPTATIPSSSTRNNSRQKKQQEKQRDLSSSSTTTTTRSTTTTTIPGYSCIALPETDEFLPTVTPITLDDDNDGDDNGDGEESECFQHAILEGYLLPNPNFANLPRLPVVISSLRNVCLDPTRDPGRGYWIATTISPHASYYWLQDPSPEQELFLLERRAQLGVVSNLLDCGRQIVDWSDKSPTMLHKTFQERFDHEPFSLDLMRAFAQPLRRLLLQVVSPDRTPFYKHLGKSNRLDLSKEDLLRLSLEAEERSQQHPWGGPLAPVDEIKAHGNVLRTAIQQDLPKHFFEADNKLVAGSKRPVVDDFDWTLIVSEAEMLKRTEQYQATRKPRVRRNDVAAPSSPKKASM
ncbi:hypothetical protein ACA910_008262 [Epithemia clementina (nom. ined.)]